MAAAAESDENRLVHPKVKAAWEAYVGFERKDDNGDDDNVNRVLALSNLKLDKCSVQFLANEWGKLEKLNKQTGATQENEEKSPDAQKKKGRSLDKAAKTKETGNANDDKGEPEAPKKSNRRVIEEIRLDHVGLRSLSMAGDRFDSSDDELQACSEDHAALLLQGLYQVPSLTLLSLQEFAWVTQAVGQALQSKLSGRTPHHAPPRFEIRLLDTLLGDEFVFSGVVQGLSTRQGPGLQRLTVCNEERGGWLNDSHLTLLVNGIVGSTTQQSLVQLSLIHQKFTSAAFVELARLLQHCTNLYNLELCHNTALFLRSQRGNIYDDEEYPLVDKMVKARFATFAQAIETHKTLVNLDLLPCFFFMQCRGGRVVSGARNE